MSSRRAPLLALAGCIATAAFGCEGDAVGYDPGGSGGQGGYGSGGMPGLAAGNGTATGTGARATSGTTAMPCNVADIIKLRCGTCHGAMPVGGPMSLVSWEDTQAPSVASPPATVTAQMSARLHDAANPMPPTGILGADELAVLDAWLNAGSPAGNDPSCGPVPVDMNGGDPLVMPDDAQNCYEIRAHGISSPTDTTPLMSTGEQYGTFYFDAPWPDGAQGVYFETLFGDHPEILHHWLIYSEENGNQPDGTVDYPGSGSHPSAPTLVAGWAPGTDNNDLPSDVGMLLSGPNRKMSMEIHFLGPEGMALPTTAGVKICTVEQNLRPNTATISWLGTELGINIPPMAQDSTAVGTCTPQYTAGDIHILRSWPHMHLMGRTMDAVIVRAGGGEEPLSPAGGWPFDYNNQVSYKTEAVLSPGDTVRTTCHFTNTTNNAIGVGFENRYEMCFNFTLAYPAKALVNRGLIGSSSLTNSSTGCLY